VKAHDARMLAAFETITYAPIVIDQGGWINFTNYTRDWIEESKHWYDILEPGLNRSLEPKTPPLSNITWAYSTQDGSLVKRLGRGNLVPSFQISPPPLSTVGIYQNIDLFSDLNFKHVSTAAVQLNDAVFSKFSSTYAVYVESIVGDENEEDDHAVHPHSVAAQPVFNTLETSKKIVGYLYSIISWNHYLNDLLPEGVSGVHVVFRNSCNQSFTYQLNGNKVSYPTINF
jgi:hypothetical protein